MLLYYLSDPAVKGGIDELAESCVGHGGFITAKKVGAMSAESIITDVENWFETINVDENAQT